MTPALHETSEWNGVTAGDWSTAGNWTQRVPGTGRTALLDGTGTYDVTIAAAESYTPDGVIISDPSATLTVAGTLDPTGSLALTAGVLVAFADPGAGSLGSLNGPVDDVGGVVLVVGASPFILDSTVSLQGGAISWMDTLTGTAEVSVPLGAVLTEAGSIEDATYLQPGAASGTGTPSALPVVLTNHGTIVVADGTLPATLVFENTGLKNDGLVTTTGSADTILIDGAAFDNAAGATLAADAGGSLQIDAASFSNAGLISDSGGAVSLLAGAWTNTGTIVADNAQLTLGGDRSLAQYGLIRRTGDTTVTLSGTLENAGDTLDAGTALLQGLTLSSGTIDGGTLDAAALGLSDGPAGTDPDNVLDGVTVINGLTIGAGALTLTDGTRVFADPAATTPATIDVQPGATLMLGDSAPTVIDQPVTDAAGTVVLSGPFTLRGTIAGTGGTIALGTGTLGTGAAGTMDGVSNPPTTWINDGAILLSAGAVELDGNETVAQIGSIAGTGNTIVYTAGTLENAGGSLDAGTASLLGLQLAGGTIAGGTLDAGALGLGFAAAGLGNDLDGVTLRNGLTISSGGVTLTDGTGLAADATSPAAILVTGSGELAFAGAAPYTIAQAVTADAGTIELGGGFTDTAGLSASNATVMLGTGSLDSWTNRGVIALAGGTLELDGNETLARLGSITDASAQVLYVGGILDNTGATLDAEAAPLLGMTLAGGTIEGGVLDAASLGLGFASATQIGAVPFGDLDNVAIINNFTATGLVSFSGSTSVYADAGMTTPGALTSGIGSMIVFIGAGPATLANDVTLNGGLVSWVANENVTVGAVAATIAAGAVISGIGTLAGPLNGSVVDLTNEGTIDATTAGGNLTIEAASLTNGGLIVVAAGAVLTIGASQLLYDLTTGTVLNGTAALRNNGTIVLNGGSLVLNADVLTAQLGDIVNDGGTLFYAGGTLDNAGATLDAASTALSGLQLAGGTIEGGTLDPAGLGLTLPAGYQDGYAISDLDNVTIINDLTIAGLLALSGTTSVHADASLAAPGTITVAGAGAALLLLGAGPVTLADPVILAGGSLAWVSNLSGTLAPPVTATIAAGTIVAGDGQIGENPNQAALDLRNLGTIAADQSAGTLSVIADSLSNAGLLTVAAGAILALGTSYVPAALGVGPAVSPSFVNTGTIALNGGTLELSVDASAAQLGSIVNVGGTVILAAGTLDNTGGTLDAATTSLHGLQLGGGTIEGGTLDVAALGLTTAGNVVGDLDNVTVVGGLNLGGPLTLSGTTAVFADTTLRTPGSIALAGPYGSVTFTGDSPFTLHNAVALSGGTLAWQSVDNAGTMVAATIAPGGVVSGFGTVGHGTLALTNAGTIAADIPGEDLLVNAATLINDGLLTVAAGAVLTLGTVSLVYDPLTQAAVATASSLVNNGTIALNGGTLFLNADATVAQLGRITGTGGSVLYSGGTLDNTGGTLDAATIARLGLQLDGGTIEGGAMAAAALSASVGGPLGKVSDLDNVAVFGTLVVNTALELTGSTAVYSDASRTAPGAIVVNGNYGQVLFVGAAPFTLDRAVLLAGGVLSWTAQFSPGATAADVTIAAGDTVQGDGTLGSTPATPVTLRNLGTIDADVAGQSLLVAASTLTNQGLLTAAAGAILTLGTVGSALNPVGAANPPTGSVLLNTGTIVLNAGSLALDVDATLAQLGSIDNFGGTVFYQGGTLDNTGRTLDGASTALRGLQLGGGTIEGGTIDIAALGFAVSGLDNAGFGDLDNVSLIGSLTVNAPVYLSGTTAIYADATHTTPGAISIGGAAGGNSPEAVFIGNGLFTLQNSITLAGGAISWATSQSYIYATGASNVTIAAGVAVSGDGNIGGQFNGALLDLTNLGTINANTNDNFQGLLVEATSFTNQGTLVAQDGGGLVLSFTTLTNIAGGTLTGGSYICDSNSQIVFGYGQAITVDAADIVLSGANAYDQAVATLSDVAAAGTLEIDAGATDVGTGALAVDGLLVLGGGTFSAAAVTVDPTGTIVGFGSLAATDGLQSTGLVQARHGTLTLTAAVSDGETIDVAADATLELGGADNAVVHLQGSGAAVLLDQAGSLFSGTIDNFASGDAIVLAGFAGSSAGFSAGTLTVTGAAGTGAAGAVRLHVAGSFAADGFVTALSGADETIVTLGRPQPLVVIAAATLLDNPGSLVGVPGLSVDDFAAATITVDVTALHGVLSAAAQPGGTEQGSATASLILSGGLAAVNAELSSLRYRAAASVRPGLPPGDTISVAAIDNAGGTASALIAVDINQPPTLTVPTEVWAQAGLAGAAAGFALNDPDPVAGEVYTVTAADTAGTLSASPASDAVVIGNQSTLLTLSGTLDGVDRELASLRFDGTADDTVMVSAEDGRGGTAAAAVPVEVNQQPLLAAPVILQGFFGTAAAVQGVYVIDPYATAAADHFTVDLNAGIGTLTATIAAGGTLVGSGSGSLVIAGSLAAVDHELASLQYIGPAAGFGADSIGITVADGQGGSGSSGITVVPPPPPVLTLPGTFIVGGGLESPLDAISVALAVGGQAISTQITLAITDSVGTLAVAATASVTASGNATTGLTLTGAAADLDRALASLTYTGGAALDTQIGLDRIDFTATADGVTTAGTASVDLPINHAGGGLPQSAPMLILADGLPSVVQYDSAGSAYVGTLYADLPYADAGLPAGPATITFLVQNANAGTAIDSAAAYQEPYAPVVGDWQTTGPYAASGIAGLLSTAALITASDTAPRQADSITYVFQSAASDAGPLPDRRLTVVLDETVPCFAAGTRIRTAGGHTRVEDLRVGDTILTAGGEARPIVWLGARRLDCTRHPRPVQIRPIEVAPHAFGLGQPSRALRLSPDHAVYAHGVLIPIKYLVNGTTVAQRRVAAVTYFHVELDRHDILLAEGLPTESYLDTGNRDRFGGGPTTVLHPDFATRLWEAQGFAPLVVVGPQVAATRRQLAARADPHRRSEPSNDRGAGPRPLP